MVLLRKEAEHVVQRRVAWGRAADLDYILKAKDIRWSSGQPQQRRHQSEGTVVAFNRMRTARRNGGRK